MRQELLSSIAETIKDYREGEIPRPTPDHVERWICQFDADVQLPMLQELDHVLAQTYLNRKFVMDFLESLLWEKQLVGDSPEDFWKKVNFHKHQLAGHSQEEMLRLFDGLLRAEFGFGIADCGSQDGPMIYLDEALFSGNRVIADMEHWLEHEAPERVKVRIIVIAAHTYGQYRVGKRLKETAAQLGIEIDGAFRRILEYENRLMYRNESQVLWPASVPEVDELAAYMAQGQDYPFVPRQPLDQDPPAPFSSESGRQLLEQELLMAGVRIRSWYKNPSPALHPLGFSNVGLGFGSTLVTYRNCPNNCPLALWFGDPSSDKWWLHRWYPLFPRKPNE